MCLGNVNALSTVLTSHENLHVGGDELQQQHLFYASAERKVFSRVGEQEAAINNIVMNIHLTKQSLLLLFFAAMTILK